ncbi:MAG TPA: FlgD immunoglobulin-like domain containing protein [Verrucomicrobiae bacterium]|jgi:flagellar hook assembly protein FlgD|nr:FlgD immunoglobulin-like domain containing protein [Verrucomicrobiae bacterium]
MTFSNLIQEISFTQPFFAPEDGTTQQITAVFAANVNWTLQIQDVNTNTVRTVTGSGGTMLFDWDGTGDGGTNLPVGTYTYLISAMTNGLAAR